MNETAPTARELAITGAACASEATAELCRFLREGPQMERMPFGMTDVVTLLTESLKIAIAIEQASLDPATEAATIESLGQLDHACGNFLIDGPGQ